MHSPHLVHSGGKVSVATTTLPPLARAPSVESLTGHEHHVRVASPHTREGMEPFSF